MPNKHLILSLNPFVVKRKEHTPHILHIAYEIGLFNGLHEQYQSEAFITTLFISVEKSGITYNQLDDATLEFGAIRGKDYVQYGRITITVLL